MKDTIELLHELKDVIKEHKDELSNNELLTRYAIIDPVLRHLGWKISNPFEVVPEFRLNNLACDYALFKNNSRKPTVIIESKSLYSTLIDKKQLGSYIANSTARFAIFSDGIVWKIFDFKIHSETDPNDRIVLEINIIEELENIVALKLACLTKENLFSETPFFINTSNLISSKISVKRSDTVSKHDSKDSIEIEIQPSWRKSRCVCFLKEHKKFFPEPKKEFHITFDGKRYITSIPSPNNPTRIYGNINIFWDNHKNLQDGDRLRISVIKPKEEYLLEIIK